MKERVILLLFLLLQLPLFAAEESCTAEGVCALPGADKSVSGVYKVLSPVGESSVRKFKSPEPLKTLSGKRIAIVGGSFMAKITHYELKRLIQRDYSGTRIYVLNEIGSAGPWPGPGVVRRQKDEFVNKLRTLKIDAVISGNGGCGLCTPKEMGSCIAAESCGIPSVMIAAPGFTEQAVFAAQAAGVRTPRIAVYPGAFSAHSEAQLLENTRKVLYPQIVSALTGKAQTVKEQRFFKSGNAVFTGTLDEVNDFFMQNNWSDGLPITPPTQEKVNEYLKFCGLAGDTVIGEIPPQYRKVTAQLVAVNAVMSGCPPEYMPILIAFTRAMSNGDFRRTLASTHAWTPYCWVNGPLARQLGIDFSQGAISHRNNARIGRFINLAMLNLAGYYIKRNRMGSWGYLMPWALAEDEKSTLALGWLPYHMQMGYSVNDNTVTAASALNWGNNLAPATSSPGKIMELIAQDIIEKQQFAIGSGTPFVYRTVMISENVARDLAKKYRTKNALEDALVLNARQPVMARAYANYYANPGSAFDPAKYSVSRHAAVISRKEGGKVTPVPPHLEWIGMSEIKTVPVMKTGKTAILVNGDAARNKVMCVPGGGTATIKIELPANWNALVATRGYEPIEKFHLKTSLKPEKSPRKFNNYRKRPGRY